MKFLVTGGAGFIGSHIVEALLARGDEVRILDDFSSGKRENISSGTEVVEASIINLEKIKPAFVGVHGVFHCAAIPRVQTSIEQPIETNEINITGMLNVIMASSAAGVKRLVYCASSAAYGDQPMLPLHEEMKPNPKSPYGLQKYVGEEYAKLASMFWNLETVSLRYFNVYGPRMAFTGAYVTVAAVFLDQRGKGQPMSITGDGTQTRDFVYVSDVVSANLLAMEGTKVGKGEVINIGSGTNKSVNEVARLISGPTVTIPPRIEPHDTLADISRAKELLGWAPQVPFEQGVQKTIEWYKTSVKNF